MKRLLILMLAVALVASANAAVLGRDYSGFDEDTTAVVYGTGGTADAAYYYGFEVAPTTTAVDLDGVATSVGDFHPLNAPTFDLANGLATDIGTGGAENLLRTDFGGSLWREQFLADDSYLFEAKINLLGTGDEGSRGVMGLWGGNDHGTMQVEIGATTVMVGGSTLIETGMDNTGWHVWRAALANGAVYVYRDGVQVGNAIAVNAATNDRTFAGDYSSGLGGDWEMEYYVVDTIPEPATMLLLGLGGLLLRRRRA